MKSPECLYRTVALLILAACSSSGAAPEAARAAGLATSIDSSADTVIARVSGSVPAAAVRHLLKELRIAPAADDTSLFTEVFEFDVDPQGRIWAYDRPSNAIFLFAADGHLIKRIGRQGAGPGEFNNDGGMAVLGDSGLAIWDARNGRISLLDTAGSVRRSWPVTTGFSTSNALYTDRLGALYIRRPVTPPREGEILGRMGLVRIKADGSFGDSLAPPDLPVQREVYVAHQKGGTSSMSSRFAPYFYWAWQRDGYFLAAHGGHYEIVVARRQGKPLTIRREMPSVPVLSEERSEEHEQITWQMRQTEAGWTWSGPSLPDQKAPVMGLFSSRDGRIWVRVAVPSERIPDDELPVQRDPKQPVSHYRTPVVYEVFAVDGSFLGRIEFPARATLMEADGNTVWVLARNEDDLPALTRFRIEPGLR
jgi:6-bladed beta-propeller